MDKAQLSVTPHRQRIRHLIGNTLSLVTNDMVNRAITFVIYALIARYLGVFEFGQMSLTLTIFYLLQNLAPVGIKILLVREISKDKNSTSKYLIGGSIVAFLTSLIALALLYIFLSIMHYATETVWIILIISSGLIPYSISSVCEAILQAQERIKYITYANVPISLARGIIGYFLLDYGYNLYWIGLLFISSFVITMIIEWIFVTRHLDLQKLKIEPNFIAKISKASLTFLGLQTLIAVSGSILPVAISASSDEAAVGIFNAANQLMAPIVMVMQSIVVSLFPRMCLKFETQSTDFKLMSARIIEILSTFTIPMVAGLIYYAKPVLLLLYGKDEFSVSAPLLQIMVWVLIFRIITSVLGRVLMAAHLERNLFNIMLFEVILTIVLSIILIPNYKLYGAAYVALVIGMVDLILHILAVKLVYGLINFQKILWKSTVATMAMIIWIIFSFEDGLNAWLSILLAVIIFLIVWLWLAISENGSWLALQKHYLGT